jgi:hypothetical protein
MMKNLKKLLLFITGMLFIPMSTEASEPEGYTYRPLVKEGKQWNYGQYIREATSYLLKGDTIINGQEYKKAWKKCEAEFNDDEWHYHAAIRELDRHVYYIADGQDKDTLMYDFSLKHGDSYFFYPEVQLRVISIFYGYIRNELYKYIGYSLYFTGGGGGGVACQVMEGIGSLYELFHPWESYKNPVFSCYEDDQLIYSSDDWSEFFSSYTFIEPVPTQRQSSESSLFDLQGRRLNAVPARGLYIKDGRKYVK